MVSDLTHKEGRKGLTPHLDAVLPPHSLISELGAFEYSAEPCPTTLLARWLGLRDRADMGQET